MTFTEHMQALVAKELSDAHGDPERMGEAIERLVNSLALVIAMATGGEAQRLNNMLEGASAHLFERASDHAKLARFMAAMPPRPPMRQK